VQKYGAFKGGLLAFWRILRCNPFSHGGVDPVPEEGEPLFRRKNFKKIPIKGSIQ
jgi:putative component of membrane protein insertase Oxa1/YidC/SpoIIIJ protein YidD